MYKEIDELIEAIVNDDVFQNYQEKEKVLHSDELMSLLNKHQMIQDDYLKMKNYEAYISIDDIREKLKEVKNELANHPQIQDYYQSYYQLNDLLDDISKIVFEGISQELCINRWK